MDSEVDKQQQQINMGKPQLYVIQRWHQESVRKNNILEQTNSIYLLHQIANC